MLTCGGHDMERALCEFCDGDGYVNVATAFEKRCVKCRGTGKAFPGMERRDGVSTKDEPEVKPAIVQAGIEGSS